MLPGFTEGQWWVQDAAAALPARLFGDVAGKTIADLCAAPGGKTAQLVQAGAQVTAVDRSPNRMARLRDNLARLSLEAETVVADAAEWPGETMAAASTASWSMRPAPRPAPSAAIPTSPGCGRKPISPRWWRCRSGCCSGRSALLRPGGTLVYCTCSLEPEEGEQAIAALLAAEPAVRRAPIDAGEVAGLDRDRDCGRRSAHPALPSAAGRPQAGRPRRLLRRAAG